MSLVSRAGARLSVSPQGLPAQAMLAAIAVTRCNYGKAMRGAS